MKNRPLDIIKKWKVDSIIILLIILFSTPIWLQFGSGDFVVFWDGWAPMVPLLQWHQLFNTVFVLQNGSGVFSPGETSYLITLLPYTILGIIFGPMTTERLFYFLSFSLSGVSMYFLIRDMFKGKGNEYAAFVAAIYYMFNFYWVSAVFEDLVIPTVLTFLPLVFLLYRRYVHNITKFRDVPSPYLFLTVLSLVLIPGIFYQQTVVIYIFLLLYTIFSAWFIRNKGEKGNTSVFRIISFPIFAAVTFVTFAYFLWPTFLYSNIIGNYSGQSSFALSYLHALTSKATWFNVVRDIQPSSFFYPPFPYDRGVISLATSAPLPVALAISVPTVFALISPVLSSRGYRRESMAILLILISVILVQMGISGPFPSAYVWLGTHLPLGTVLEDPNMTIGFLEPFLISILIGTGLTGLISRIRNVDGWVIGAGTSDNRTHKRLKMYSIRYKLSECRKEVIVLVIVIVLVGTSLITAIPVFTGSFIPSYNSLDYSCYGPTIGSKVAISPQIQNVMDNLRNLTEGKRILVLPLESGINMQTGNLSYVTSNNVLQLETGADIISDNAYGFGPNSSYILSSINDLIYNTYYYYHGNYSLDQYFISTTNFTNALSALGIRYVLLVPGIPETPVNTYYPMVNYSIAKFFLSVQKGLPVMYSNEGYFLYNNTEPISSVANSIMSINSSHSRSLVSNFNSTITWRYYNASRLIMPMSFRHGFMFNYTTNANTYLILPERSLNVSSDLYDFLNLVGKAVNATVSFYYVYEFGKNYTFEGNYGTKWFPMTRYSQSIGSLYAGTNFQNVTLSTQIPYLPWLGKGNVSKIDWLEIAISPAAGLKSGDRFGFALKNMFFSNYSLSLSTLAYSLTKGYSMDYFSYGIQTPNITNTKIAVPEKVREEQIDRYRYSYSISGANGTFIIDLPETYNIYWGYSIISGVNNVSSVSHVQTDGFQNSYIIKAHGNVTLEISFTPQSRLSVFAYISMSLIAIELSYILYAFYVRKKNQS